MRPIDADALIEKCGGWYVDECTESGFIGTLKDLLATEPTIQPQSTDLIDRQAVIDELRKFKPEIIPYEKARRYVEETIDTMYNRIEALPPAQPEPHEGEWEQVSAQRYFMSASYFYRCSACGVNNVRNTNFCPHCGSYNGGGRK